MTAIGPIKSAAIFATALAAAGCGTTKTAPIEARLADRSAESVSQVASLIGGAIGRRNAELGPSDLVGSSTLFILPPAPGTRENRSLVVPEAFDLKVKGDRCYAVRRSTGDEIPLPGVACEPI